MSGNTSRSRTRRDGTARRGRAPATPPTPASARGLPQAARSRAPAPADEPVGCRAHEVLARVGDKWSVYVIHVLGEAGTLRFGELRRRVEGISQRMLTVTLRSLERDGLVSRRMYPEVPPRVEYALTPVAGAPGGDRRGAEPLRRTGAGVGYGGALNGILPIRQCCHVSGQRQDTGPSPFRTRPARRIAARRRRASGSFRVQRPGGVHACRAPRRGQRGGRRREEEQERDCAEHETRPLLYAVGRALVGDVGALLRWTG